MFSHMTNLDLRVCPDYQQASASARPPSGGEAPFTRNYDTTSKWPFERLLLGFEKGAEMIVTGGSQNLQKFWLQGIERNGVSFKR